MATRVTRSSARFEKPVEAPKTSLITKTTSTQNRRRQRKTSESSEKSIASPDNGLDHKTNVNITPPKQGKYDPSQNQGQLSPSTLLNRMSLDANDRKSKPKNTIDDARKILNIGDTDQLYGREKELAELTEFLESNVTNKTSASMYISGQPGKSSASCPNHRTNAILPANNNDCSDFQAREKQQVSKNYFDHVLYRANSKRSTSIVRHCKHRP